jgi:hypothetical protein
MYVYTHALEFEKEVEDRALWRTLEEAMDLLQDSARN